MAAQPFLPRPALVARIAAAEPGLILLMAAAGSGKTMAMLAFARAEAQKAGATQEKPCHWIDPAGLAEAPRSGALLIDSACWPEEPQEEAALLTRIRSRLPRQRILVALNQPLPPGLRDEWIAGRAAVIRAQDLAFTPDEAAALFGEADPSREVHLLHQFTGGWPLGLGLLSREAGEAFALMRRDGSRQPMPQSLSRWFDDWLARNLDEETQHLLMDLAVFGQFPAALLQALPGREAQGSGFARLAPLLEEGLFLHERDQRPGWFALMPAFARYLCDRLERLHPDRAAGIRRFAVDWAATTRDASAEMRHGLAVWTREEAIARVDAAGAIAVSLARGPDIALEQPISAASALTAPLTFFGMIYERIRIGAFEEARVHYENAAALTEGFTRFDSPLVPEGIRGWIKVFAAVIRLSDDAPVTPEWRAGFDADLRQSISASPVLAMAQSTVMMLMALNAGAREEALSVSRLALQVQERGRADKAAIFVCLHRASALMASARLEEAREAIAEAQSLAAAHTYADSYELISCQIHAGLCAFEAGDPAMARGLLEPCYEHFPRIHGWRRNWLDYFSAMAELAFQAKGAAAAELWIRRGLDLAAQRAQPQLALGLALCRLDLASGFGQAGEGVSGFPALAKELRETGAVAPQIGHLAWLIEVEHLLAEGRAAEAASAFAAIDRAALAAHDLRLELRAAGIGLEIALHSEAFGAIQEALPGIVGLAKRLPRLARQRVLQNRIRLATEALSARGIDPGPEVSQFSAAFGTRGRTLLSPRESSIIGLIAEGLSTKEIAKILGCSEGTVKSHRKNLYEKLNVGTRSRAIARAKELGLA